MTESDGRVDLDRMREVDEAPRNDTGRTPVLTQAAVARIDRDRHMVGRAGRFRPEADVRATFDVSEKCGLGGPPGAFPPVTFALAVESPTGPDEVRRLVVHAERACHAAQTFRTPVPTELRVTLNGNALS